MFHRKHPTSRRSTTRLLALVVLTMVTVVLPAATTARAAPGDWTPADVNAAVAKGVAYLDSTQNADGSFGSGFPPAETAFAIIAYGVLDKGDFHNLTPVMQAHLHNAVTYLLSQQAADGSFGCFYCTYTTGLALDALSASSGVDPGIPAAISSARTYLISIQNAPPAVTGNPSSPDCSTDDHSGTDNFCGGWNYDAGFGRSDESNTGFALTGLFLTGGVPAATASINIGWQRHVQELQATNYFAARNDGGGDYEPGISFGGFSSNANNTGSLLFGLGYDGVVGSDAKVQAALIFGTDVLDEYELMKDTVRSAIYHFGMNEDGTCTIGDPTCDWGVTGDGGYHYSLWSLTKGFGQFIPPELSNPANWYAKVVDLLLSQQNADGSWPVDGRDDFSSIVATSFAVDALGLVGVPTHTLTVTKAGSGSGTVTSSPAGIDCGSTCSASFSQGTMVTLTATAAAGSTFTGWSGACSGTGTCTVTMDQDRAVTATFDLAAGTHTLTVTKSGSGSGTVTSSPTGIDCGSTCSATFSEGTTVTLTATPAAGSTFTGWGGDCTGTGTCTVTMDQDRAVTATFDLVSAQPALSQGYWRTHQAQTTALLPITLGNYTVDTFAKATAVFGATNCGSQSAQNAIGCLTGQLLAAKLNVKNGAGTCIAGTIADADAFLISIGYTGPSGTYSLTSAQRDYAIQLKDALDKYNNGLGC